MGGPFALDMGAVMQVGVARGIDMALLAEVLPAAERAILEGFSEDGEGLSGEEESE